ncbi:anti-sigma factor family protein [Desulfolucanica intricata]|uniref:anti-sigma factor family protein n=1 Tax=Desulfolucanica intricata TaxID=1285191 RepID=UPI0008351647|nr:zf-HC2 domain-containing protein [Desulfolucanica intricata]
MCCDVGILQAYLDQELEPTRIGEIEAHLAACAECRRLLEELRENDSFVTAQLEAYSGLFNHKDIKAGEAWSRFTENHVLKQKKAFNLKGVFNFMKRYKLAAAVFTMVLAFAVSMSFSSVRSFAGELLTVFRVEKVETIDINPNELAKMQEAIEKGVGEVDIDNFGNIKVSGKNTQEPVTLDEAQKAVDFTIKLPSDLPGDYSEPVLYKNTGSTASLTLDVDNVNQLLMSLGSSKLLPQELDNKTFTLHIPVAIGAEYTAKNGSHLMIGQTRSPEMVVPEGVDVNEIRSALVSVPVLPESLKKQLVAINDWQHTVLVPNIKGSSQEVMVNGVQGVFMSSPKDAHNDGAALLWQKDGVIYVIAGSSLTLTQAQSIAASMR